LLDTRTQEALLWKRIATSRYNDLVTVQNRLHQIENLLKNMPLGRALEIPYEAVITTISDPSNIREGISSTDDFCDSLVSFLKLINGNVMSTLDLFASATQNSGHTIGLPSLDELDDVEGLSLEEMGHVRSDEMSQTAEDANENINITSINETNGRKKSETKETKESRKASPKSRK